MNHDGSELFTNEEENFLEGIKSYESRENSYWKKIESTKLSVIPVSEIDISKSEDLNDLDLYADTEKNSKLYLCINEGEEIPMDISAITSYKQRCRIGGSVLQELKPEDFADILNICIQESKGNALIRFAYGKARAVLAGDPKDYSIIKQSLIFEKTSEYLKNNFKDVVFTNGTINHYVSIASWVIQDKKIKDIYEEVFGLTSDDISFKVNVCTSDTGYSGANISYGIKVGRSFFLLNNILRTEHKNSNTIDDFLNNLNTIFAKFKKSLMDIKALQDVKIKYPEACIRGVMSKCGIGKKNITTVLEYRKNIYGEDEKDKETNAYELYLDICYLSENLIFSKKYSKMAIAQIEERIARCILLPWEEYDVIE